MVIDKMNDTMQTTIIAAIVLFPLIILYRSKNLHRETSKNKPKWSIYLLVAFMGIILNGFFSYLMELLRITERFSNVAQDNLLSGQLIVQLLGLGVLIPITEELLFRGLFYSYLKKYMPWQAAMLLGAFVFAVYHGNMIQIIFAFPMGIIITLLYQKWNAITIAIVFHAASNLAAILFAL